jgi:muramoyltetrapeptide carboxypeptidase LdcA involved in peptidoglycan recycling
VHHHGVTAFHGPAVMAGLAQARGYPPDYLDGLRAVLFNTHAPQAYRPFDYAVDGYADWSDMWNATRTRPPEPARPMRKLQGEGRHRGWLWGGCLEVLEMLKGTPWWPAPGALDGAVLLLEGSEEAPPPTLYRRVLRSWAAAGHLGRAAALVVGRPARYDAARRAELDSALLAAVAEAGRPDMPVLVDACFGHTDPQWVLPLGGIADVDADRATLALVEPAVR